MRTQGICPIRMTKRRSRNESGSLTVELVVVTPVLFLMALTVIVFGRISEAHQQVIEASRAAAEAPATPSQRSGHSMPCRRPSAASRTENC